MRYVFGVAVLLLAMPESAHASFWDIYGFNPRAIGLAGTHVAIADDFTAVHHNPAALTAAEGASYGFALVTTRPRLRLDFDKEPSIAPLDPPDATSVTFGGHFPLSGDFIGGRISMGFGINVPTRSILNGQALDPAIPHWSMYHALPERIAANVGLGASPLGWLSLGVGVQFLAGLEGSLDYELDIVAGQFSRKTVLFDIAPKAAPVLGLEIRPVPGLRIGASWRQNLSADVVLPVHLVVTGIAMLDVYTDFTVQYLPDQFNFGVSYKLADLGLLASAEVTWALWSDAPDPAVDSRLDVSGELFEGTGLAGALDAPAPGKERQVDLGYHDVVIVRAGLEKELGPVTVRGGYSLRPSPSPVQSSGTNYVDGTAHVLGLGVSLEWRDPWDILANPMIGDLGTQLWILPERQHEKIDPADPIGSYGASGVILVGGIALRYRFGERALEEADKRKNVCAETKPDPVE